MKTSEHLQAVEEKLSTPDKWTKSEFGRDGLGNPIPIFRIQTLGEALQAKNVCSRCLMGAMWAVSPDDTTYELMHAYILRAVLTADGSHSIASFNDNQKTTHQQVIRVIRMAKQEAEHDETRLGWELIRGA